MHVRDYSPTKLESWRKYKYQENTRFVAYIITTLRMGLCIKLPQNGYMYCFNFFLLPCIKAFCYQVLLIRVHSVLNITIGTFY